MASAAAAKHDQPKRDIQLSVRLTLEQSEILQALANVKFEGSRSWACSYLIDLHAGREIERVAQEQEAAEAPVEIVRWKSSRLSRELAAYIAGLVRAGNLLEKACDLAGVTSNQRITWMRKGRHDRREGKQSLYADFVSAVAQAEAECEAVRIARLTKAGQTSWQATAWLLERQNPDTYAQRKRIDGKVQHSLTPMIDYDRLTAGEIKTLVALLRKASPERDDPHVARDRPPAIATVPDEIIEIVDGDWTEAPALEAPQLEPPKASALESDSAEAPALEKPPH